MKQKKGRDWFPLYVDKWLFGSTRHELKPDERSVWTDLMVLSAKDEGYIRANEGVPYPNRQLAGLFCISESLLSRTIERCLKVGKLQQLQDGTLFVPSWNKYPLSDRMMRMYSAKTEVASEKAEMTSAKTEVASEKLKKADPKLNKMKEDETKRKEDSKESTSLKGCTKESHPFFEEFKNLWNETVVNLPKITNLSTGRENKISTRFKEHPDLNWWKSLFEKINASAFLCGKNDRNWKATFDWFVENDTRVLKVMEGQYDNATKRVPENSAEYESCYDNK